MSGRTGGAYGLQLPTMSELAGLTGSQWLQEAPIDWPVWTHSVTIGEAPDTDYLMNDEVARVPMPAGQSLRLDRVRQHVELVSNEAPPLAAWAHPLLSPVAILAAEWRGLLAFHSGAFVDAHGRAWALFGRREDGKSTALAWLADHGHPVIADDLVVTDGQTVFRGPRCVDLRDGAAPRYPAARSVGSLGDRERWRYTLPAAPAEVPLAGFIELAWSDDDQPRVVDRSGTAAARAAIQGTRALLADQQHPLAWLAVLALPVLTFKRRRSWSAMDIAMETLLEVVKTH